MEVKRDKYKGFVELKKLAAEKILKIASNKLFIDTRKVHRFRIWQGEYLNHVMHGIGVKDQEKQLNLKRKYLQFFVFLSIKHLRKALYKWNTNAKLQKIYALPSNKMKFAILICAVLLRAESSSLNLKEFPLFYAKGLAWKNTRVKVAVFKWKRKTISALLNESHREMAIIKINHFLHKKTTPLISFAVQKICQRLGLKFGCLMSLLSIKSILQEHKHFAFMSLCRKRSTFTPKSRFMREKRAKNQLLQKFASIKKLTLISNKKFHINPSTLSLFNSFSTWKRCKSPLKSQRSQKSQSKLKGPSRQLKSLSIKFLFSKSKSLIKRKLLEVISRWRHIAPKIIPFPIDKNVYTNQAQIGAYIESRIISKSFQVKKAKKNIKISSLDLIIKKALRHSIEAWQSLLQKDQKNGRDEDVLFEYIHYLEDNLGVPHKFRH